MTNAVSYVVTNLALLAEELQGLADASQRGDRTEGRPASDAPATIVVGRAQLRRLIQLAGDAQSGAERTGDLLRQLRVLTYGNEASNDDSGDDTWDEDRKPRQILVVDDEPFILASLQRALSRYAVQTAEGGEAAVERLSRPDAAFDLVLCDLVMPPYHGSRVYKWICEHRPHLADRVIFMTAGAFTEEARGFLHSVRNPVLHKPFDTKTLRWAIGQALRRGSVTDPPRPDER
jgi:CheY-like chemotaxis protein